MSSVLPDAPEFQAAVFGTVFADRASAVARLKEGDQLILVPDPPGVDTPSVWVHAPGGDVLGHVSPDINAWMVPAMLDGVRFAASVAARRDTDTASWQRLLVTIRRG